MDDLISKRALYKRTTMLEAQALDYVGKLIERDGDEPSVEWKVWSAILTERTAFKHDVLDAPVVQSERKKGRWLNHCGLPLNDFCSVCAKDSPYNRQWDFCPNCGADMRSEE